MMMLLPLLLFQLYFQATLAASCTFCLSGEISKPQQELNIEEPFPLATCQDVNNVMGFIEDATDTCAGIRTLGGLCGCPAPQNGCRICPEGQTLVLSNKILDSPSIILDAAPIGLAKTCAFVESWIQTTEIRNSGTCNSTRIVFEQDCLCAIEGDQIDDQIIEDPTSSPTTNSNETSSPPVEAGSCSICPDGGKIANPDIKIPIEIPDSPVPIETCRDLEASAVFLPATADECVNGIQLLAGICGCGESSSRSPGCHLCPNSEVPKPDNLFYDANQMKSLGSYVDERTYAFFDESTIFACKFVALSFALEGDPDSEECFVSQLRREICGCEPHPKMRVLNWCRRISAMLSFLGSLYIVISILKHDQRQGKTYHQLMLGISFFDIIGSLAYLFGFALLPSGASIPNARGNLHTCTLQGTMIQLSNTGVMFNLLLALYFLFTVSRNWKEHQFKKIRRYVYAVVLLVGAGLALGAIPLYEPLFFFCGVPIPPFADSWTAIILLFFIPFGLSIVGILWATAALFLSVYKLEKSSSRWRLSVRATGDSMTEKVFWCCFWYLLAILIPWLMYFACFFVKMTEASYPFFVALQICIPIQGFLNALIYKKRSNNGLPPANLSNGMSSRNGLVSQD